MKNGNARKGRLTLRIALPVFFAVFVLITGLSIFSINFYFSLQSLNRVSFDYLSQTGQIVLEKTTNHLSPAQQFAEMDSKLLNPENFDQEYFDVFNTITLPQFQAFEQFALIYYGSDEGNFWMNAREKDNTLSTQIIKRQQDSPEIDSLLQEARQWPKETEADQKKLIETISPFLKTEIYFRDSNLTHLRTEPVPDYIYDPRWRPWYKNSQKTGVPTWSSAYTFSSSGRFYASGKIGVTVSAPVYDSKGNFRGAVGVDIILEELSRFLQGLQIGKNGRSFLFNQNGSLIAFGRFNVPSNESAPKLLSNLTEAPDVAVKTAYANLQQLDQQLTDEVQFDFANNNKRYLASFFPLPEDAGPAWFVGIIVPEDDFIGELKSSYLITIIISALVLFTVVLLSFYISNMITLPIKSLTAEALRVRGLDLDNRQQVEQSMFKEISDMSEAFDSMKSGIRSFKKYVPGDVVAYLIRSGKEAILGGEHQNVSIFFSDIADFTTIAENMAPDKLVPHLGQYMGTYSEIIGRSGGTVDKYIGDAIMAFWNAPTEVANHPLHACGAALSCVKEMARLRETWKEAGLPELRTRIGLHTGDVIVGNMGSEERLNYTIIGDSVNLASRLEGLGKLYGVDILASDSVYEQAHSEFEFRRMDRVVVKGKTTHVTVYELLGKKGELPPKILTTARHYEAGLKAYFQQDWVEAFQLMREVLRQHPNDKAAKLMLARIKRYKDLPPGTDWDGVSHLTAK